jgi:hypothetical protein
VHYTVIWLLRIAFAENNGHQINIYLINNGKILILLLVKKNKTIALKTGRIDKI